jgi:hypothetical protein
VGWLREGGERTQTLYAHMNKIKKCKTSQCRAEVKMLQGARGRRLFACLRYTLFFRVRQCGVLLGGINKSSDL